VEPDRAVTPPSQPAAPDARPPLPPLTPREQAGVFLRLLAIQGSWNYELLVGNGVAFCVEPLLRRLPGGRDGVAYRAALARQAVYFNTHPYLAGLAVGALARAECEGVPAARIERFRTALCGPLGSVGDRLVWASWLPACSLVALLLFGAGVSPVGVMFGFLALYNIPHLALRHWALRAGWRYGLQVAAALGHPVLQHAPRHLARAAAVVGGLALPLAVHRAIGGGAPTAPIPLAVAVATPVLAGALVWSQARVSGRRAVLILLVLLLFFAVVR
jgi:PTS system mannose-specific IID component